MTEQIAQTSTETPTKRPKAVFASQLLFESNTIAAALTDKLGIVPLAIPITLNGVDIQTDHIREATGNAYDCLALLQKEVPDADLWVSYYRCVHPDWHRHWLVCGVILVQNRFCKEPVLVHTAGIPISIDVLSRTRSLGFKNTTIGEVLSTAPDSQQSFLKETYTKELAAISESIASAVALALDLLPENVPT
jgi:hypothetical protein